MPEPPKITTSLADRIARLNATRSTTGDRNHTQIQKEIGEVKSKISKYEESGQHEAPLLPKGSFGLGAPLTKPDRGLDRIRIASSGVSGGMTVSIKSISSPSSSSSKNTSNGTRSVSVGHLNLGRSSSSSNGHHSPSSPSSNHQHLSNPATNSRPLSQSSDLTDHHPDHRQEQKQGVDCTQAYDGILEGYPTTPAEEETPPLVTCSNCDQPVDLELLADHVCNLSLDKTNRAQTIEETPSSRSNEFPVDVANDPEESLVINDSTTTPQSTSSISTSLDPHITHQPNPSDSSTLSVKPSNQTPTVTVEEESISNPVQQSLSSPNSAMSTSKKAEIDPSKICKSSSDPTILSKKEEEELRKLKNRNSDASSLSTNTTRLSAEQHSSITPASTAPTPRRSFYYDDDDDINGYQDSGDGTGFVTIVRSGHR